MPAGTVVDAFKSILCALAPSNSHRISLDLIRHGKHHNHNQHHDHRHQAPSPPQHLDPPQPLTSPTHREAAQLIVEEERQARSKLPMYDGLDNFQLQDKMGESVDFFRHSLHFLSPRQRCFFQCL